MSEIKLAPCPFCGGVGDKCSNELPEHYPMYWVLCRRCHASPGDRKTEAEAEAAWNRRSRPSPVDPALVADLQALKAHHEFTRDRIGQEGCPVRLKAAEFVETIDLALEALSTNTYAAGVEAAAKQEIIETLWQYESDLRHPPTDDSRERRIERIRRLLASLSPGDVK